MHSDLPARPKSQRLANRTKADKPLQYFQQFQKRAQNITNINDLLPGLNDISDAFEAMPMDLFKYFTLLKEIDAKCIKTVPLINHNIGQYIDQLHTKPEAAAPHAHMTRLQRIRKQIHEVIPCLEEKMHVTSVAADVMAKHMYRINNDYKVIIGNNEIPESVRVGPLNHRALILDPQAAADAAKSAQSQRSETRREALAARKAHKDPEDEDGSKKRKTKEPTPLEPAASSSGNVKKRRKDKEPEKAVAPVAADKKKTGAKPRKDREPEPASHPGSAGAEPTYCYCNQISFGEMVGCDGDTCEREWFHLPCIGFKNPPKGKWYCDDCVAKMKKAKKP
ncbi:hypothetical protein METBIDRAFT_79019 [Metschnikowia bicuspidata var. bicuspidata NRRL YB-4993]|uniref:Chromatin modification-related protein n=1 Tax=Metschnikowia bicuspidata var. bicuspidata NRRL YB-4993 TaxID=869754 RepID=A0A1A0HA32_9ASCO|nr:hypothetical protein METBIDRAFT_79019 [Metschnikowia bicuspidata var. bicuspidata NRRL YB-4993]OBA20733.1 hypothetical protein METBIDRAFT_79019 [Metschnikowia bicuspidata var. bicuspidata NRRL YB-4993]